jgi:ABC-2 type transport system ATP-binding protein
MPHEAAAPGAAVVACGLAKHFGEIRAVADVSFSAQAGEVVGFLGPNGAGKTTTLRMLTTCLAPTSGSVSIAGFDALTQGDEVRRRIGYLPEVPPLYGEMTVVEYLSFAAELRGVPARRVRSAVADVVEKCALGEVRRRLCQYLSRGFCQRVGLAQAIIHDPEVIILDEPTSGLDPQQILQIRKLILSLAHGRTLILSTHLLPEVTMVCSRVVIINRGRVALNRGLKEVTDRRCLEEVFLECVTADEEAESIGGER